MASDSIEGVTRLQKLGSKSKKRVWQKRIKTTLPREPRFGDCQGAIVWSDVSKKDNVILPMQVGFPNEKGEREFYAIADLDIPVIKERVQSLQKQNYKILAPSKQKYDETVKLLLEKGIIDAPPKNEGPALPESAVDNDRIMVIAKGEIDRDIQRAIAKIAFNYLAKIQGCEYVLKENFNEIRSFIIGTLRKSPVTLSDEPILADESKNWRHFHGHIFIFERVGDKIISKISLFNGITYIVLLTDNIGPLWYPLKSGHAFDVERRRFIDMVGTSLSSA